MWPTGYNRGCKWPLQNRLFVSMKWFHALNLVVPPTRFCPNEVLSAFIIPYCNRGPHRYLRPDRTHDEVAQLCTPLRRSANIRW